jgi:catechol 2,3-dioxygenase-like lactoylglutathione lyase family enzyme
MLNNATVYATIAVNDIEQGKEFYGKTLGLRQIDENPGGVTYQSGTGKLFVYQSSTAGTSEATTAAWDVDDVEVAVDELKAKGITFEHYDTIPGAVMEGEIAVMGQHKAAWFKDPDGNILSIGG